MASDLLCPVGVTCTLRSPQTGQGSHQSHHLSELRQSPMLPTCLGGGLIGGGCNQRCYPVPCSKARIPKSVQAVHPSCSCLSNQPLLVLPLTSRWQQTQQQRQL